MRAIPIGGACSELPLEAVDEYFFPQPHHRARIAMAKRICNNCIVFNECYEYAMEQPEAAGIYAALTVDERLAIANGDEIA